MSTNKYISPEITLFDIEVEQGFGASQGSPDFNIGIGEWEVEEDEFNLK